MTMAPANMESTPCPLCGSEERRTVCEKGQFGLPTFVGVCKRCGFSYLSPRWSKERYDQFYAEEYDRYYRPETLGAQRGTNRFLPIKAILARLAEQGELRHFNNVLDIGSGMGDALVHLKSMQSDIATYEAIEPSPTCRDHLVAQHIGYIGSDVYAPWDVGRSGRYDLVIMRHVLEHFHEPLTVLRKVHSVLADGGLLYVAVPDAMHPTKPLRSHFFRVVHINYFSLSSLTTMLHLAGLEPRHASEGDRFDEHEVYAMCRKGAVQEFTPDPTQADRQLNVYHTSGKWDAYHELKSGLISVLRRLHLLR